MENVLAKTKQAVSRYKSRSQSDNLNATKSVWAAVRFLRKQLPDLERKDRGVTTRIARELSELLSKLPMFRHLREDKEATDNLHSKPQGEELIINFENQLKQLVKDLENSKIDEIKGWVENHPVLGSLTKTLTRKMPESTYVFLFRQLKNNSLELVTSRSPDGRVFTRFRPREFFDVKKLYRLYHHRPPVGAAVVVDNKLQDVIGTVPQPNEGEDQLQIISTMSKDAASQPAKVFLSSNSVLQTLHGLVKERKIDKSAYILLFVDAQEEMDFDAELDDDELAADDADESVAENAAEESGETETDNAVEPEVPAENADAEPAPEAVSEAQEESTTQEATSEDKPVDETPAEVTESESVAEQQASETPAEESAVSESEAEPAPEAAKEAATAEISSDTVGEIETPNDEAPADGDTAGDATSESASEPSSEGAAEIESGQAPEEVHHGPVEILTRAGSDGGVLTRYYGNEFSDVRKVFETFGAQRTIAGAAIIRGRELVQVVGNVPQPPEGKSQLDALILESNHAADKPTRDFLADNEILNTLHELASGDFHDANAKVLLFIEEEGRLSAMVPPPPLPQREERGRDRGGDRKGGDRGGRDRHRGGRDDRGRDDRDRGRSTKTSMLTDFRYPREIRNNYRNKPRVVGASVIGEFKAPQQPRKDGGDKRDSQGRDDKRRDGRRNEPRAPQKSVVLAAFGRTPLRENILITEETTRRLGLDFFNN